MTAANEYLSIDENQEEAAASGNGLFGIEFTPPIIGAAIAVLGLGLAAYLGTQVVMPVTEENGKIAADIQTKEDQVNNQKQQLQKKAEAEAKLATAEQRRSFVTTMFASEKSMETLLLDVNQLVDKINAGVPADDQKAKLTKFEPVVAPGNPAPGAPKSDDVLNDTSLGRALVGQLRRKSFRVEFEGNFGQTRSFLQNLERMQSLLLVRNLKTQLVEQAPRIEIEFRQGKIVPIGATQPKLKTSFDLFALLPLKQEEKPAVAASPSPTK